MFPWRRWPPCGLDCGAGAVLWGADDYRIAGLWKKRLQPLISGRRIVLGCCPELLSATYSGHKTRTNIVGVEGGVLITEPRRAALHCSALRCSAPPQVPLIHMKSFLLGSAARTGLGGDATAARRRRENCRKMQPLAGIKPKRILHDMKPCTTL